MKAPARLTRLIGQHPAAIRTVCWRDQALGPDEIRHLELESKHGHVVVIDHASGDLRDVFHRSAPPRQQRDLTAELAVAFDGRPRISAIEALDKPGQSGWTFTLSTGRRFSFCLDPETPLLLSSGPSAGLSD